MDDRTIADFFTLSDSWKKHRQEYLSDGLVLCEEFVRMYQSCDLRPLYGMNLIDVFNPKEPITSRMLEMILSYSDDDGYIILKNFCQNFLEECGFDCRDIAEPKIIAERDGHIDIRITEEGKYAIIIENKLKGAPFQRNQLARYIRTVKDEGLENDQIFIVVLPRYCDIRINTSVWRLPVDYDTTTNDNRKCGIYDKLCWCDCPQMRLSEDEMKHCGGCKKTWREEFSGRTRILHQEFAGWLMDAEEIIPRRELIVRSAMLQFADYLNGLYQTRIDQKLNKMITDFLRDKLQLGNSMADWKKLNTKIAEIEELKQGLETLRLEMSSDLIDQWYERLQKKWPMLRNEPGKSFGILIRGMWFGCWWAEESDTKDSPIWGIYCENRNPEDKEIKIARKIISACGLPNEITDDQWLTYANTLKGDRIADKLYTAAAELGFLK